MVDPLNEGFLFRFREGREPQANDVHGVARRKRPTGAEAPGRRIEAAGDEHGLCGSAVTLRKIEGELAIDARPARLEIEERSVLVEEKTAHGRSRA